ncbi:GcrA family cell cycle regulator [Microvirga subterranea]|uniref:GcrA family cell cycle regulator n=1 Tax=Microvirga subterranea TaxID=186651 RepID=UPI000E0C1AAB
MQSWNPRGPSSRSARISAPGERAMPEIIEPSPRTRTTLFKLRARQCRFIVSDDRSEALFCGAETQDGSSWCAWHRRLVYTKPLAGGSREKARSLA